jgi:hypothetical protein
MTIESIQALYPSVFDARKYGSGFQLEVRKPPSVHLLSVLIDRQEKWLTYVLQHYMASRLPAINASAKNSTQFHDEFVRRISSDEGFNALVLPTAARALREGGALTEKKLTRAKYNVPIDQALLVAVRFFYPDLITPTGIATHICVGENGVKDLKKRDIGLEAFAYSAIMSDMQNEHSRLAKDFYAARALMLLLDSSGPDSVRLNRAQGVMWSAMAKSTSLRQVLLAEARRVGDLLPFDLNESRSK